jgi:hypothetical protein
MIDPTFVVIGAITVGVMVAALVLAVACVRPDIYGQVNGPSGTTQQWLPIPFPMPAQPTYSYRPLYPNSQGYYGY